MGRILAIDYGTKRTGLAVTDPLKIIASPLETVPTHTLMAFVEAYVKSNEVEAIVVGMPRQMNGEPSASFGHIRPFVERLKKQLPGVRIDMFDERFTSKLAMGAMIDGGVKKSQRQDKGLVDRISASIILQGYLESREFGQR